MLAIIADNMSNLNVVEKNERVVFSLWNDLHIEFFEKNIIQVISFDILGIGKIDNWFYTDSFVRL